MSSIELNKNKLNFNKDRQTANGLHRCLIETVRSAFSRVLFCHFATETVTEWTINFFGMNEGDKVELFRIKTKLFKRVCFEVGVFRLWIRIV